MAKSGETTKDTSQMPGRPGRLRRIVNGKRIRPPLHLDKSSRINFNNDISVSGSYVPTDKDRADVIEMSSYGVDYDRIASVLNISKIVLMQHFERELATALEEKNKMVARGLYQQAVCPGCKGQGWPDRPKTLPNGQVVMEATRCERCDGTGGSLTAQIFWLRTRARWKIEQDQQAPMVPPTQLDYSKLTMEEMKTLLLLTQKAKKVDQIVDASAPSNGMNGNA